MKESGRFRQLRSAGVTVTWLYSATAFIYLFQLITTPYLTRVLGPDAFGEMAASQSIGAILAFIIDLGYSVSAAKRAAECLDQSQMLGKLVVAVSAGKSFLCLACLTVVGLYLTGTSNRLPQGVLALGIAGQAIPSLGLNWFYLATGEMYIAALSNLVTRGIALGLLFVMVRSPRDLRVTLALQLMAGMACVVIQYYFCVRRIRFAWPTFAEILRTLRDAWTTCWFRSGFSLYFGGNAYIMSLYASPAAVGYYSGAERLVRAVGGLLSPLNTTMLPLITSLLLSDPAKAKRVAQWTIPGAMVAGGLLAAPLYIWNHKLAEAVLGRAFAGSGQSMRVLSLALLVMGIAQPLLWQWVIPKALAKEPLATIIGLAAQATNILLSFHLVRVGNASGPAWAIVASELVILCGCVWFLRGEILPRAAAMAPFIYRTGLRPD